MSFKNTIHIVGMKAGKGTLDNGQSCDSTKACALTNLNTGAGTSKGMSCSEYNFGTSAEFENFFIQAKRILRNYNGIHKAFFPLFLKECEFQSNYGIPSRQLKILRNWCQI